MEKLPFVYQMYSVWLDRLLYYVLTFLKMMLRQLMLRSDNLKAVQVMKDSVFITGCDSGIGHCFAKHLASLGCVVFAGVFNESSDGAKALRKFSSKGEVIPIQIDVRDKTKISACVQYMESTLKEKNLDLLAVINNAGVMVFGEFEWQTLDHIENQIDVNISGYMRVARAFCPLLRKHKGRLVNISSHCATTPLPCLSVYSATKAAVEAWSSALAFEMFKFDVPVITIHPGSYARESNILTKQKKLAEEMWESMDEEQKETSEEYFHPIMEYMAAVPSPSQITDPSLLNVLQSALLSTSPRQKYVNSPWRYSLYYNLISWFSPFLSLQRKLILSFINLPKYR